MMTASSWYLCTSRRDMPGKGLSKRGGGGGGGMEGVLMAAPNALLRSQEE